MTTLENDLEAEFGGPGPEDVANGAAALAAGLVREAQALASSAAALRAATQPGPEGGDVRRMRLAQLVAAETAMRAALALDAAAMIGDARPAAEHATRIGDAAKRAGLAPASLAPLLRAAALAIDTDDGAARIAASTLAADLCALLAQDGG